MSTRDKVRNFLSGLDAEVRAYRERHPDLRTNEDALRALLADEDDQDHGAVVDRKVREHMQAHGVKNYGEAMTAVLRDNKELAQRYESNFGLERPASPNLVKSNYPRTPTAEEWVKSDRLAAGVELDTVAKRIMSLKTNISYLEAFKAACNERPDLCARYRWTGDYWDGTPQMKDKGVQR